MSSALPDSRPDTIPVMAPAREAGRTCAVAARGQRDLQACAGAYPDLFPDGPFDPALFSAISLATAFSAPWLDAAGLRAANRAALWAFAVDRRIDVLAASEREVTGLTRRCRAISAGASPGAADQLGAFLAVIRDDLAAGAGPAAMTAWRRELSRMLSGMGREWRWRHGGARPTVAEYLDNADNLGLSFVFVSHLVHTRALPDGRAAARVVAAGRAAQRAVRLVNDLATYRRDLATGDLNVLRLGATRRAVRRRLADLLADCRARCDALRAAHPHPVAYVERQVEFNLGFHPVVDYWGA